MKPIIHIIDLRQLPKPFDEFLIPAVLQILNVVSDKVQAGEGLGAGEAAQLFGLCDVVELEAEGDQMGELLDAAQGVEFAMV